MDAAAVALDEEPTLLVDNTLGVHLRIELRGSTIDPAAPAAADGGAGGAGGAGGLGGRGGAGGSSERGGLGGAVAR